MKKAFVGGRVLYEKDDQWTIDEINMITEDHKIIEFTTEIPHDAEIVSLKGKWVFPGLINTHGHLGMTILRGYSDDVPLEVWLERDVWPMEAKFTKETVKISSQLAMLEMVKSGTTTFLDMYHPLFLHDVAEIVENSGMRAAMMAGVIGFGTDEQLDTKLNLCKEFIKEWHQKRSGRISGMMSPHSGYTCKEPFLRKIIQAAVDLNVGIHTHMSETETEVQTILNEQHDLPAVYFEKIGMFNVKTILAHVVHITDEEIDILNNHHVSVAHNPTSNLKLGSGVAPIVKMMNKGINVSLGTDSAASNNNLDMIQEMRLAALLQKGMYKQPDAFSSEQALFIATKGGARALQLNHVGALKIGNDADFFTIDPSNKPHLQPDVHMLSHLVYSASGQDVADVYVQGKCLVQNGTCLTLDEEKIIAETKTMYEALSH